MSVAGLELLMNGTGFELWRGGTGLGLLVSGTAFGLLKSVAVLLLGCLGVGQVLDC